MNGFFSKKETEVLGYTKGKRHSCASCGLYRQCESPKMKPYGNFKKGILNIGEAPGGLEDERGKPWQGKSGRVLQRVYRRLGIDLFEDCLNINAVNCYVDAKSSPTNFQIDSCRKRVFEVIEEYNPKVIVLFGKAALYSVIGDRWKRNLGGISKWRGWTIPDRDFKAWVCPTFHPSYISREHDKKEIETIWIKDIEQAVKLTKTALPRFKTPDIEYITNGDLSPLKQIRSDIIAFDYEATGIKPHAPGHRIVCASVADSVDTAYSFLMPPTKKGRAPFINLLADYSVTKMAHNMKYEEAWSVNKLRQPVIGWGWDSMLAAHILDNRSGVTSLKFQVYVNFGIVDYEEDVASYFKSAPGGNSINNIFELLNKPGGVESLLKYCALDSIYEFRLAMKQQEAISYDFLPF